MVIDVFPDGFEEFLNVAEDSSAQLFLRQVAEEPLDHVQPGAAGGGEMHVEPRVAFQPALHQRMFVGGVVDVADDQMNVFAFLRQFVDDAQETQPFLMALSSGR